MKKGRRARDKIQLRVLNPRGKIVETVRVMPARRLQTLNQKKIAVLINTQSGKHDRLISALEDRLKRRFPGIELETWRIPYALPLGQKKPVLERIADQSDAVVGLMGDSGSCAAKTAADLVDLERMGRPTVFLVLKYFEVTARTSARTLGLPEIRLLGLQMPGSPFAGEDVRVDVDETLIDDLVSSLTEESCSTEGHGDTVNHPLIFKGRDLLGAVENMEKHFLNHCWSDGFPLKPPTPVAVRRMVAGADLPADHVVGVMAPGGAEATVEKIAINAVMAGCLPQHMPVLLAATEALIDPRFDLLGIQCTAGMVSPLLLISGKRLIEQLNMNDSYGTLGPGWRSNATIGRALRLMMINIGHAWPGNPDMKAIGTPFKYVMLMAENEKAYQGAWEPIRVAEGFRDDQPTVSVMPAVTWQVRFIPSDLAETQHMVSFLGKLAQAKNDNVAGNWGMDNLILLNWTAFDIIRREGYSREQVQRMIYEEAQQPWREFFGGKEPSVKASPLGIPEEIVARCRADSSAKVPLVRQPENIKMVVAGAEGYGTAMVVYISTWGYGPAHFVTKSINVPGDWEKILKRNQGWETPVLT